MKERTIEELEELAFENDTEAIQELARRYSEGDGVAADMETASIWKEQIGKGGEESEKIELKPSHETNIKLSWDEQFRLMKSMSSAQLREKAADGNAVALIVRAENYLSSVNQNEFNEGLDMLEEAENALRADFADNDASFSNEALVYLFNVRGEKLERLFQKTGSEDLPEKIFTAYSNAYELDPTQTEGIARCYERGIGVEKNTYKARTYREQSATHGGIEEKYRIGREAYDSAETIRSAEWLQSALMAKDAEEHEGLKHFTRLLLARLGSLDEEGHKISEEEEMDRLLQLVGSKNDSEAALCMASLSSDEKEKLRYYELGATGGSEKYASICVLKAEEIRTAIEEVEKKRQDDASKYAKEKQLREEERRIEDAVRKVEQEANEGRQREEKRRIEERQRNNGFMEQFQYEDLQSSSMLVAFMCFVASWPKEIKIGITAFGVIITIIYLIYKAMQ